MKITPEAWKRIDPLLTVALELPEADRSRWLAELNAAQGDIAPLVSSLLKWHETAERRGALETVPRLVAAPSPSSAFREGERMGPYRLVRLLGRGGMGEVWLAEQADGRVERRVALKLPTLLEAEGVRAERFGRERDILARLEHPRIARLYDAGVGERGQPWLAMEFVEGEALDAYAARRGLGLRERIGLMRQVCAAVAHAHRFLVVHRDLKPANILVDASGTVRLLDFGIAKLLGGPGEGAAQDFTRLHGRVLTLRYAAPEQVADGAISTATDIYALGVILHEVLTGLSPYRAVREGRPLTEAALLGEDVARPSTLAIPEAAARERGGLAPGDLSRRLAGDLDAIVLKSLRRDAAERYASVGDLDDDIRRHLERLPVRARAGTWRYLAGRFASRHRVPIGVAAGALVLLVGSLAAIERERREAVAERARAERHFAGVRRLASALIFDVHAQIENVPGTLRAREKLVSTSLAYLDGLAAEAGHDPALVLEIAGGYRRIAAILGGWAGANKGEVDAAIANYEKARGLLDGLGATRPADLPLLRERASLALELGRAYFRKSDRRWEAEMDAAARLAGSAAAHPGAGFQDDALVHAVAARRAAFRNYTQGQSPELEAQVARAVEGLEAIDREHPADARVRTALVGAYGYAAAIHAGVRATPEGIARAIDWRRKGLAGARELVASEPENHRYREMEQENAFELARLLSMAGEHREAGQIVDAELARVAERRQREPDPGNTQPVVEHLHLLSRAARVASAAGDHGKAVQRSREALALVATLPEEVRASREVRVQASDARILLGGSLLASAEQGGQPGARRLALLREGCAHLDAGAAWVQEARERNLTTFSEGDLRWLEDQRRRCTAAMRDAEARAG